MLLKLLLITLCVYKNIICAPIQNNFDAQNLPSVYPDYSAQWYTANNVELRPAALGDWIMQSDWFPIEINVPDAIQGTFANVFGGSQNFFTRIPFIHRLVSPERPRPLKFYAGVPYENEKTIKKPYIMFNPFSSISNKFPYYP